MKAPALLALLLCAAAAHADDPRKTYDACRKRGAPEVGSVRTIELRRKPRVGPVTITRANLYDERRPSSWRRVVARLTEPEDLRGATFVLLSKAGWNELYFRPSDEGEQKKVTGADSVGRFFGSDFSYEDLAQLEGFGPQSPSRTLYRDKIGERVVDVIELRPAPGQTSAYTKLVASLDPETCAPLRTEMYEAGGKVRKLQTIDPLLVLKRGKTWIPQRIEIEDKRDGTSTRLDLLSVDFIVVITPDGIVEDD